MASLTTTSTSDKAAMKQSMRNEAEAMNNMEGKDEKGDIRVTTMAAAIECLNGMIPADGGEGGRYNYPAMHLGQGVCAGKDRQDVGLIRSFNSDTSCYWRVLTIHSFYLFNDQLICIVTLFIILFFIVNFHYRQFSLSSIG